MITSTKVLIENKLYNKRYTVIICIFTIKNFP